MKKSIEDYFARFDGETQRRLNVIRDILFEIVPEADEDIKYQMPTVIYHGNLIHYAAFKNHVGIYPLPNVLTLLENETRGYKTGKGSIQFQNDEPLPVELIRKIALARKEEKDRELREKG